MMAGHRKRLGLDEQRLLAAYATKHVPMMNFYHEGGTDAELRTRDVREFRQTARPLPNSCVWIGALEPTQPQIDPESVVPLAIPDVLQGVFPENDVRPHILLPKGSSARSIVWGSLVIQWAREQRIDPDTGKIQDPIDAIHPAEKFDLMTKIWPSEETASWPLPQSFNLSAIVTLRRFLPVDGKQVLPETPPFTGGTPEAGTDSQHLTAEGSTTRCCACQVTQRHNMDVLR